MSKRKKDALALRPPDTSIRIAGEVLDPKAMMTSKESMVEVAANLMGLARDNMRQDIIRIATQEFDYIIRRRREVMVELQKFQNVLLFLDRKQKALEQGEFEIDTTSGKITFHNVDLQPWL
jgi:hypothetical protein